MDDILRRSMLFDFYGELLKEEQQKIYEDAYFNDLSLSEVAEIYGITRQGVHDCLKRCDKALNEYESKLKLVEKFELLKKSAKEINSLTTKSDLSLDEIKKINLLSTNILEII